MVPVGSVSAVYSSRVLNDLVVFYGRKLGFRLQFCSNRTDSILAM